MSVAVAVTEAVTGCRASAITAAAVAISAAQGIMVVKASTGDLEAADIAVCFPAVIGVV
jgi:hypothetical protein